MAIISNTSEKEKSPKSLDRHSPRVICAKRSCERLSTSGNFCLDGRFPETCMVWVDLDPTLPRIQCGACNHIAPYSAFVYENSRAAVHRDLRCCPRCGHALRHPTRTEENGRVFFKPGCSVVRGEGVNGKENRSR
ncbi:MAG: hypothetical protein M1548_08585 [Actinobacteria bacterium]|nr:hypothetical protein [Actinomycetota bacterium]